MCSSIFLIFCLFTLFPSAFSSGTLRLEFTPSHDCVLNFTTTASSEFILLSADTTRTVSFHSLGHENHMIFKYDVVGVDARSEFGFYSLKVSNKRKIFAFGGIMIAVRSIFKCDPGFVGRDCQQKITTTTSTTTLAPPTSTEIPTLAPELSTIASSSVAPAISSSPLLSNNHFYSIIIVSFIIFILIITLIILISCSKCRRNTIRNSTENLVSPIPEKKILTIC